MHTHKTPILLIISVKNRPSYTHIFSQKSIRIGRLENVDLRLDDPRVSRMHAVIESHSSLGIQLIDMGSAQGTFVNGQSIRKSRLQTGDQIQLGTTSISVYIGHPSIQKYTMQMAQSSTPSVNSKPLPISGSSSQPSTPLLLQDPVSAQASIPRPHFNAFQKVDRDTYIQCTTYWNDRIVRDERLPSTQPLTIGTSRDSTFCLDFEDLHELEQPFSPVEVEGEQIYFRCTDSMKGELYHQGENWTFQQLKDASFTHCTAFGYRFPIPYNARISLLIQSVTYVFEWEDRPILPNDWRTWVPDTALGRAVGGSFILHGILTLFMLLSDESPHTMLESITHTQSRFHQLIVRPNISKQKSKNRIGGQRNHTKKPIQKTATEPTQTPHIRKRRRGSGAKQEQLNSPVQIKKLEHALIHQLSRKGLLGLLKGGKQLQGALLNTKSLGGNDTHGLGAWRGTQIGSSRGQAGLDLRSGKQGTMGLNGRSEGIGELRSGLRQMGKKGPCCRVHSLTRKRKIDITPTTGKMLITNGLDRSIIQRIIRRHRNRFKYCYERELIKNRQLAGQIHVQFQIQPTGRVIQSSIAHSSMNNDRVERCILQRVNAMRFPHPKGGGVVIVRYPFHFRSEQ